MVAAFLGACVAAEDEPSLMAADFGTATLVQPIEIPDASNEALALYLDLTDRLEARGVTPEEMQDAIDAGDEAAIREMFGFTDEELEDAHRRLLAVAEGAGTDSGEMEKQLKCDGTWGPCFAGAAWLGRSFAGSGWLSLAIYAVGAATCAVQACSWEDEPTPRRRWKQP